MVNVTETSKDFAQEKMYKCLDCEEQFHEEFAVCDECGSEDIKEVVRYQCPECSMVFDDYGVSNKCPNCGYVPKGKIAWVRKPQFGSIGHHVELAETSVCWANWMRTNCLVSLPSASVIC